MISKSISTSTNLAEVSTFAKLLFTWLVPHCDDYGHMDGTARLVKGIVVPLCDESMEQVESALQELEKVSLIRRYEVEGRKYLEINKWELHQTLKNDRPLHMVYPLPTDWNPKNSKWKPEDSKRKNKLSEVKLSEDNIREEKDAYGEFKNVLLKKEEYQKLVEKITERNTNLLIEELSTYLESKGVRYRSHYATLLNWARRKYQENQRSQKPKRKIA